MNRFGNGKYYDRCHVDKYVKGGYDYFQNLLVGVMKFKRDS